MSPGSGLFIDSINSSFLSFTHTLTRNFRPSRARVLDVDVKKSAWIYAVGLAPVLKGLEKIKSHENFYEGFGGREFAENKKC